MIATAGWFDVALGLLCALVGCLYLLPAATRRLSVAACAAHALMCFGMTAMLVPWTDPLPREVWLVGFVLVAAWFAAEALDRRESDGAAHHVVGFLHDSLHSFEARRPRIRGRAAPAWVGLGQLIGAARTAMSGAMVVMLIGAL